MKLKQTARLKGFKLIMFKLINDLLSDCVCILDHTSVICNNSYSNCPKPPAKVNVYYATIPLLHVFLII